MSKRNNFYNGSESEEDGNHWLPVGDLMAGLMFLFILALAAYMLNITKIVEDVTQSNKLRTEILLEIKDEMVERGFSQIVIIENQGIIRLEQGVLFDKGEADLLISGRTLLADLGPVMNIVLSKAKYKDKVDTIFIEGHTDSDPIVSVGEFKTNWDLSAFRAINTWRFLSASENQLEMLENINGKPIFSISGYAESRPVSSNDTEEGKRNNRRIDFRVNMTPPPAPKGTTIENDIINSLK